MKSYVVELWQNVSPGQGTIISGALTFLAAVVGVLLGSWLFSGRVRDLKSAVDASDRLIAAHAKAVEQALSSMSERLAGVDVQIGTLIESSGRLQGAVGDIQSAQASDIQNSFSSSDMNSADLPDTRAQLWDQWEAIRDELERIAADPLIDGRTRARYARIDRRRYGALVEALMRDNLLGARADAFRQAVILWQQHRAGRRRPTTADVQQMKEYRGQIVPG